MSKSESLLWEQEEFLEGKGWRVKRLAKALVILAQTYLYQTYL
jgi:hypothetical protein